MTSIECTIVDVVLDPRIDEVFLVLQPDSGDEQLRLRRDFMSSSVATCPEIATKQLQRLLGYRVTFDYSQLMFQGVVIGSWLADRNSIRLHSWWVCRACGFVTASSAERCAKCTSCEMVYRGAISKHELRSQRVQDRLNEMLRAHPERLATLTWEDGDNPNGTLALLNGLLLCLDLPVVAAKFDDVTHELIGFGPYTGPAPQAAECEQSDV